MAAIEILPAPPEKITPAGDTKKVTVLLCEPSYGLIDAYVYDNRKDFIAETIRLEQRSAFKFATGNTARLHINYAREIMAEAAIKEGLDYIFMVDDDMLVPKDCFERTFNALVKHEADIAAPLCTQRLAPFNPVMWREVYTEKDGQRFLENKFIDDFEPNAVVFPDMVGFGVVLIKVEMLKKMKAPYFFSNTNMGEDLFFCLKAKHETKAKIVVDTSIKIGHLGYPNARNEYDWIKQDKARFDKFKHLYTMAVAVDPEIKGIDERLRVS